MLADPRHRFAPAYYNYGVVFFPGSSFAQIAARMGGCLDATLAAPIHPGFYSQLALTLAIYDANLPHVSLDLRYNYPNEEWADGLHAGELEDVRIIHYSAGTRPRHSARNMGTDSAFRPSSTGAIFRDRTRCCATPSPRFTPPDPPARRMRSIDPERSAAPARRESLPFGAPTLGPAERDALLEVLDSGWIGQGRLCAEFERRIAEYVGVERGVFVNSATAGLHLALLALGVGQGDEVITTPMTFVATVNVIEHCGATPSSPTSILSRSTSIPPAWPLQSRRGRRRSSACISPAARSISTACAEESTVAPDR